MTLNVGLIAASLMLWFAAAGCTALLSRLTYANATDRFRGIAPGTRANLLFAWAALPLSAGILIVLFVLSPSIAHVLGLGVDHCHAHAHHPHLCVIHTPLVTGSTLELLIFSAAATLVLVWAFAAGKRLWPAHRALRTLLMVGRPSPTGSGYDIIRSAHPFALTVGLMRPRVLVSSRLLAELNSSEVATVISHERAHQRRRDGLRLFVAECFAALHLPATRHLILAQFKLAVEQACDEVAASRSGDRLKVAETILKLTRLARAPVIVPGAAGLSFNGADATRRIQGLLDPALPARSRTATGTYLIGALLPAIGLVNSEWWHHTVESLLASYLG